MQYHGFWGMNRPLSGDYIDMLCDLFVSLIKKMLVSEEYSTVL